MDRKDLAQYRAIAREITMLKQKLGRLSVRKHKYGVDTVSSSSPEAPYRKRIITISGYGYDATNDHRKTRLIKQTKERLKECEEKFYEIQAFIDSIEDGMVRQIIEYKYIEGLTWTAVARKIYGYPRTGDDLRMRLKRFFE
jgi:hypothetical protein